MAKSVYVVKTTSGEERSYTQKEMLEIARQYLVQKGSIMPTKEECLNEIDDFVSRFKLVDNNEANN